MKCAKTKGKNRKNLLWAVIATILVSLIISGGGSAQSFGSTITRNPTFTSTPLMNIKVMSYNVLFGAGVNREYDDLLPADLRNKNRLPKLVSFINGVKPDILGIQEANGWDRGDPPIVEQVAQQLDMNYFLAEAPNEFNVVLFTKFKITEVKNLFGQEGDIIFETMRGLKATLLTSNEQPLNIFVIHLDPFLTRIRLYQLDALIEKLDLYREQKAILLGDMNFCVGSPEYTILTRAGWQHVALATDIDQIWIPFAAPWTVKPFLVLGSFARDLSGLSDHLPVGAEINMYPTGVRTLVSTPYPYADQYIPGPNC